MLNGIRVFDTVLDGKHLKDTVSRNSADFWKPFCKSAGWEFSHERVNSLNDLEYFFSKKTTKIKFKVAINNKWYWLEKHFFYKKKTI